MEINNLKNGVHTLKELATNLNSLLNYIGEKDIADMTLLKSLDDAKKSCMTLTNIFEKEFMNLVNSNREKERMIDDGK
jgi:hypothetical protein